MVCSVQMRSDVRKLEGEMQGLKDNQLYCNEGILTLCSSLREIIAGGQKSKYTSVATLDSYINRSKHMPLPMHAVCLSGCVLLASLTFQCLAVLAKSSLLMNACDKGDQIYDINSVLLCILHTQNTQQCLACTFCVLSCFSCPSQAFCPSQAK